MAGNAIGPGIVLDFSRHMNRIIAIDETTGTADVEAGVVLAHLTRETAQLEPQRKSLHLAELLDAGNTAPSRAGTCIQSRPIRRGRKKQTGFGQCRKPASNCWQASCMMNGHLARARCLEAG